MKKYIYYLFNVILIGIIICNLYFLCKNIFIVGRDTHYIQEINKDFEKMIKEKLNDNTIQNIHYIKKVEVGDNFPTGVYNIKISYINKNGLEESTIITESVRHEEKTLITDYIKENGVIDNNLKVKYCISICLSCLCVILIIVFSANKNKFI